MHTSRVAETDKDPLADAGTASFLRSIIEHDLRAGVHSDRHWAGSPGDAAHQAVGLPDSARVRLLDKRFSRNSPDYRHTSDAFSSPPVRAEPVEALHSRGKPWLRRAQPERMQGYLRQVTNQGNLTPSAHSLSVCKNRCAVVHPCAFHEKTHGKNHCSRREFSPGMRSIY